MAVIDTSAAAFVAGMVTSVHCVGMCGPLACSWAGRGCPQGGALDGNAFYHGARLVSYGLVGTLAGALGVLPLRGFQHGGGALLPWLLVAAFLAVGVGVHFGAPKTRFAAGPMAKVRALAGRLSPTRRAALLGLMTPLLPCGPLYVMFGLAMVNGSALRGAEFALAFGLGTVPLLWLAQTRLQVLGARMKPETFRALQRGLALTAAVVMAWRLRGTLDGSLLEGASSCCH